MVDEMRERRARKSFSLVKNCLYGSRRHWLILGEKLDFLKKIKFFFALQIYILQDPKRLDIICQ